MRELQFPLGEFDPPDVISADDVAGWIAEIEALPAELSGRVARLSDGQLEEPYRPGGWTPRQVVHHLADSHMNSVVRFKLALTEDVPTIRPYDEGAWARLPDVTGAPLAGTLDLLAALHARWVVLLAALDERQLRRTFRHPELGLTISLDRQIGLYAWHGRHHCAHIDLVAARTS